MGRPRLPLLGCDALSMRYHVTWLGAPEDKCRLPAGPRPHWLLVRPLREEWGQAGGSRMDWVKGKAPRAETLGCHFSWTSIYSFFFFFPFWPHLQHVEGPGPGIQPTPQL